MSSTKDIQPLLPASEVLQHVIDDLEDAANLLKDADPIITEGVRNNIQNDNGLDNNNLNYRQLRLNYYAVQALLARAYSWGGNKTKAYQIAKEDIIDKITTEELEVFPWATEEQVTMAGKPDRIFSSEVFFALYKTNLSNIYTTLFSSSLDPNTNRLSFVGSGYANSKLSQFYDDENDWRYKMWDVIKANKENDEESEEGNSTEEQSLYLKKFQEFSYDAETNGTELYRYMMPLIRLSEVYLIAAEGAPTHEEALQYINTLRLHRNCIDLSGDKMAMQRIKEAAEKAKIDLSGMTTTDINLPFITADATGPKHLDVDLTRQKFEALTRDLVEQTVIPMKKAIL